ncbi:hypothetical protein ACGC1H_001488 [Rhizoctonia solani]|uniref:Uncharacterized protein n=1 Tax=Rhizoctonia solani TaxID=456999 RepID=A0A8H2XU57_9AGAM|nr:unnamed protein product [Rhizoctonia solani]
MSSFTLRQGPSACLHRAHPPAPRAPRPRYCNNSMGRPLWLHISALSPDEYEAYPPALEDIASIGQDGGKEDWESRSVSVLVAKGWMKGRYRDQVEGEVVDKILRFFHPNPSQADCLSAGQFFAVLRLISHAQRGHALDKSLVFIQARVTNEGNGRVSPHKAKSLHNLRSLPPAPIRPSPVRPLQLAPDEYTPGSDDRHASAGLGPSPVRGEPVLPKSAPAGGSSNPFRRTLSTPGDTTPNHFDPPPLPGLNPALVAEALANSALVDEDGSPIRDKPTTGLGRSLSTKTAPESPSNPFRRSSHSPAPPPVRSHSPPVLPRRPPLPPPRDSQPILPPPRHPQQPVKPPKPSTSSKPKSTLMPPAGGTPSELIKQSLRAAKGAQRANETSLEKQRTWEVIKSSNTHTPNSSGGVAQALAQLTASNLRSLHHAPHPPPGPSTESSSLDHVATARPDPVPALPPLPPKPASHHGHSRATSTSRKIEAPIPGRPVRSKSLHHSPSHTPPNESPIQPPPRRRPESIQFTGGQKPQPQPRAESPSPNPLSRRTSVRSQTFYDEVRRRAGELEPRLDAVRAKAEGKLSSRGYVTRRGKGEQGEPLVDLDDDGASMLDGDVDWREWDRDDDVVRRFRSSPTGGLSVDRDEPTSDHNGWRPLAG